MSSVTYPGLRGVAGPLRAPVPRRVAVCLPELLALLALTGVLNLWDLSINGWANTYYAAAIRSMSTSWHDFLFASLDKTGLMTVDKPPLAFWVQALSVRVFGFSSLSILVPEALMGVAAVGLVYDMTRRMFGRFAGAVAGLTFALTPITVAIARHNNPDELLILCCVAALWCAVRALETGRTRWLVLCGVCVGLGFETKMLVALFVVPGIALAWMWMRWGSTPAERLKAFRQLLAGGVAMTVVGLAWPLLVTLTPGRRPALDLRHRRQQHLVADLRLQRHRAGRRPDRRPRWRGGRDPAAAEEASAATCSAAPPVRSGCSPQRLAIRPGGCSGSRSSPGWPC